MDYELTVNRGDSLTIDHQIKPFVGGGPTTSFVLVFLKGIVAPVVHSEVPAQIPQPEVLQATSLEIKFVYNGLPSGKTSRALADFTQAGEKPSLVKKGVCVPGVDEPISLKVTTVSVEVL